MEEYEIMANMKNSKIPPTLICVIVLLHTLLISRASAQGTAPPLILAVDGIDRRNVVAWFELLAKEAFRKVDVDRITKEVSEIPKRQAPYLADQLKNLPAVQGTEIKAFHWSGDLIDTPSAVAALRTEIADLAQKANKENRRFVIVAHSWGTVLAYRALHESDQQLDPKSVELITMGSPLNSPVELFKGAADDYLPQNMQGGTAKPRSVDRWTNYIGVLDPVASSLPGADQNIKRLEGHLGYSEDQRIGQAFVEGRAAPSFLQEAVEVLKASREFVAKEVKKEAISWALQALGVPAIVAEVAVNIARPKVAQAPTTDPSQRTAQQQLTPVTSSFTQTYSGTMSQTIGVSGSRTTPFSGSFTGTRTGAAPGDFTGTFTGTNVYNPPVFANPNYRNISFTATMTGQVNGFQGQDLKGTANATITDGLVPTGNKFTYSGNVTIKTDKSLTAPSLTGENFQFRGIPGITPGIVGTSTISHTQTPR